jgi:hypothetical protein
MSSDWTAYNVFMANWDQASDDDINAMIEELGYFKQCSTFEFTDAVNTEFDTLVNLARKVRDSQITADTLQITADAAAVAAFWSFGLSMAAFAVAETGKISADQYCAKESKELNEKLASIDVDIATKIGRETPIYNYIKKFKANNSDVIPNYIPHTMAKREARSIILQFFCHMELRKVDLTPQNFRMYANSSRVLWNSNVKDKIMDALDKLNLSPKTESDIKDCMNALKDLEKDFDPLVVYVLRSFSIAVMFRQLGVANERIANAARAAGFEVEEVGFEEVFEMMDVCGKVASIFAVGLSIVNVMFSVWGIVNAVEQCNTMVDTLEKKIKAQYISYFQGLKASAARYVKAAETNNKKED